MEQPTELKSKQLKLIIKEMLNLITMQEVYLKKYIFHFLMCIFERFHFF